MTRKVQVSVVCEKPGCCQTTLASFSGRNAGSQARAWLDGFRIGLCEISRSEYDKFNDNPWVRIVYATEEE